MTVEQARAELAKAEHAHEQAERLFAEVNRNLDRSVALLDDEAKARAKVAERQRRKRIAWASRYKPNIEQLEDPAEREEAAARTRTR